MRARTHAHTQNDWEFLLMLFQLLTLSSLIFSTLVRKSSSRLVQASLWLSDVRARKYATASLQTLWQTRTQRSLHFSEVIKLKFRRVAPQ